MVLHIACHIWYPSNKRLQFHTDSEQLPLMWSAAWCCFSSVLRELLQCHPCDVRLWDPRQQNVHKYNSFLHFSHANNAMLRGSIFICSIINWHMTCIYENSYFYATFTNLPKLKTFDSLTYYSSTLVCCTTNFYDYNNDDHDKGIQEAVV